MVEERVGAGVGVGHKAVGRVVSPCCFVGEGQTEENHSGKGETRIAGLIRVSWTVDHGV